MVSEQQNKKIGNIFDISRTKQRLSIVEGGFGVRRLIKSNIMRVERSKEIV